MRLSTSLWLCGIFFFVRYVYYVIPLGFWRELIIGVDVRLQRAVIVIRQQCGSWIPVVVVLAQLRAAW